MRMRKIASGCGAAESDASSARAFSANLIALQPCAVHLDRAGRSSGFELGERRDVEDLDAYLDRLRVRMAVEHVHAPGTRKERPRFGDAVEGEHHRKALVRFRAAGQELVAGEGAIGVHEDELRPRLRRDGGREEIEMRLRAGVRAVELDRPVEDRRQDALHRPMRREERVDRKVNRGRSADHVAAHARRHHARKPPSPEAIFATASARSCTSSFRKSCLMWYATVLPEMPSPSAISWLLRPCAIISAISRCCEESGNLPIAWTKRRIIGSCRWMRTPMSASGALLSSSQ